MFLQTKTNAQLNFFETMQPLNKIQNKNSLPLRPRNTGAMENELGKMIADLPLGIPTLPILLVLRRWK